MYVEKMFTAHKLRCFMNSCQMQSNWEWLDKV